MIAPLRLIAVLLGASLAVIAQTPAPDHVVFAGLQYDQASAPQSKGFAGYAKLVNAQTGTYSYTRFVETSVRLKPQIAVQTQTEVGVCSATSTWGSFDVFAPLRSIGFTGVLACATGGIAAAAGDIGASGSGTLLAMRDLGRGWSIGIGVSPSYSAVTGKMSYPVGLVFGFGR